MNTNCRLTEPLETRLPAGSRLLRARTGPGDSSVHGLLSQYLYFVDLLLEASSLRSILQSHPRLADLYRYILVQVSIAQVRGCSKNRACREFSILRKQGPSSIVYVYL